MSRWNTFPQPYDQIIAENYALPANATPVILTNTVKIESGKSGNIWVRVFATPSVADASLPEITNPATLTFVPVVGPTATSVATWGGTGNHKLPGTMISAITASASSTISWAQGQLMCEFAVPKSMIKKLFASNAAGTAPTDHLFMAVYVVAVSDEHLDEIEAYVYVD